MSNDPYFDSRFLEEGTEGGEFIYNEFLHRLAAGFGTIKSRTTSSAPGSPVAGDAYLIPSGASDPWDANIGDLAIYTTGWIFLTPKAGMRFYVQDQNAVIDYSGAGVAVPSAIDGHVTLTPVFQSGEWQIVWDGVQGTSATVTLNQDDIKLIAPTNWRPGRIYTLTVIQDSTGSRVLTYETSSFYSPSGDNTPNITSTANARSMIVFAGPAPSSRPTQIALLTALS